MMSHTANIDSNGSQLVWQSLQRQHVPLNDQQHSSMFRRSFEKSQEIMQQQFKNQAARARGQNLSHASGPVIDVDAPFYNPRLQVGLSSTSRTSTGRSPFAPAIENALVSRKFPQTQSSDKRITEVNQTSTGTHQNMSGTAGSEKYMIVSATTDGAMNDKTLESRHSFSTDSSLGFQHSFREALRKDDPKKGSVGPTDTILSLKSDVRSLEEQWNTMYDAVATFSQSHGHFDDRLDMNYNENVLRDWIIHQRKVYKLSILSSDRVEKLKKIGFDVTTKQSFDDALTRIDGFGFGDNISTTFAVKQTKKAHPSTSADSQGGVQACGIQTLAAENVPRQNVSGNDRATSNLSQSIQTVVANSESDCSTNTSESDGEVLLVDEDDEDYNLKEQDFLKRLDNEIFAAEEGDFMAKLDKEISIAEERERKRANQEATNIPGSTSPYMRVMKQFPKYIPGTHTPFITHDDIIHDIIPSFLNFLQTKKRRDDSEFSVYFKHQEDNLNYITIVARGRQSGSLSEFLKFINSWRQQRIRMHNYNYLQKHGLELEVEIEKSERLGGILEFCKGDPGGLLISMANREGPLAQALGPRIFDHGASVISVDGLPCRSISDFKQAVKRCDGQKVSIIFCVSKDADLSGLQKSCLVKSPHLRDGNSLPHSFSLSGPGNADTIHVSSSVRNPENTNCDDKHVQVDFPNSSNDIDIPVSESGSDVLQKLLCSGINIVIDIDTSDKLGIKLSLFDENSSGLRVKIADDDGGFARALGPCIFDKGACILFADDLLCQKIDDFRRAYDRCKGKKLPLHLCVSHEADLSKVQEVYLRKPLSRRDGKPFVFPSSEKQLQDVVLSKEITSETTLQEKPTLSTEEPSKDVLMDTQTVFDSNQQTTTDALALNVEASRIHKSSTENDHDRTHSYTNDCATEYDTIMDEGRQPAHIDTSMLLAVEGDLKEDVPAAPQHDARQMENSLSYQHFARKYKDAVIIEFSGSEINHNFVIGCMWSRHRTLVPKTSCNENCGCVFFLPVLGENVVTNQIAKSITKWSNPLNLQSGSQPVGFMKNFAKKFLPLLKAQHPTESPAMLLKRLYRMWDFHKKNFNFGLKCVETCECEEGWSIVFGEGDPDKEKLNECSTLSSVKKRGLSLPSNQEALEFKGSLPRKIRKLDQNTTQVGLISNLANIMNSETTVPFQTNKPLGFYCVTDTKLGECKITSVYSKGQAGGGDVRVGAKVVGVVLDGTRHEVKGHLELREIYNRARLQKKTIILCLTHSSEVINLPLENSMENCWSNLGLWRGGDASGWAGGASSLASHNQAIKSSRRASYQESKQDCDENSFPPSDNVQERNPEARPTDWIKVVSSKTFGTSGPRKPILSCKPRLEINKKYTKVVISETVEERRYIIGSRTTEFLVMPDNDGTVLAKMLPKPQGTLSVKLDDAFANEEVYTVVQLLENGAAAEMSSTDLYSMRDGIKHAQGALYQHQQAALAGDPAIESIMKKDKLLKVYINSEYAIKGVKALKNWVFFDISIDGVDGIPEDRSLNLVYCPAYLYVKPVAILDKTKPESLKGPPRMPLAPSVSFMVENHYKMKHNSQGIEAGRILDVSVMVGGEQGPDRTLGTARIPMSHLYMKCSQSSWHNENFSLTTFNGEKSEVYVKVRARRHEPDKQWLDKKRSELTSKIRTVIDWIQKFNDNLNDEERKLCHLSANIRVGGLTILHAAVLLEDTELVETLLSLGADPLAKSERAGSALSLSSTMAEGQVALTDERRSRLQAITELLRKYGRGHDDDQIAAEADIEYDNLDSKTTSQTNLLGLRCQTSITCPPNVLGAQINDSFNSVKSDSLESHFPNLRQDSLLSFNASLSDSEQLPFLPVPLWLIPSNLLSQRCTELDKTGHCSSRHSGCKFIHVQAAWGKQLDKLWQTWSKRLNLQSFATAHTRGYSPYSHELVKQCSQTKSASDSSGRIWYTAGFSTVGKYSVQEVIFAEGGEFARRSDQGLYWYPSEEEAMDALQKVVSVTCIEQGRNAGNRSPRSGPVLAFDDCRSGPMMSDDSVQRARDRQLGQNSSKDVDDSISAERHPQKVITSRWLESPSLKSCQYFKIGRCRYSKCHYWHIQPPLGDAMLQPCRVLSTRATGDVFERYVHYRQKIDSQRRQLYTAGYRDPVNKLIFYAEGGQKGNCDAQGVWWYPTKHDATESLRKVISVSEQQLKENELLKSMKR